jgi:hypothetical protein
MPSGVPIATPMPHIIRLPTMALRRPPASSGGGWSWVNSDRLMRQALGQQRPQDPAEEEQAEHAAAQARPMARMLTRRRRRYSLAAAMSRGGHDDRVHRLPSLRDRLASIRRAMASTTKVTMNSTKPSSSSAARYSSVASPKSLAISAAMVVPGSSSEAVKLHAVADHEGDRHGFAQRAAQAQEDAADHRRARVGQHDVPAHFPLGRAQRVGRFLQARGHGQEHLAHHRGDERESP